MGKYNLAFILDHNSGNRRWIVIIDKATGATALESVRADFAQGCGAHRAKFVLFHGYHILKLMAGTCR
jgi:hypothetical protein